MIAPPTVVVSECSNRCGMGSSMPKPDLGRRSVACRRRTIDHHAPDGLAAPGQDARVPTQQGGTQGASPLQVQPWLLGS
jgi:hypothetical protein